MPLRAHFTDLLHSSAADWDIIRQVYERDKQRLPDKFIFALKQLEHDHGGYPINRFVHSLQTATRAWRDGRDDEYVCCALLHDLGAAIAPYHHAEYAAMLLRPFVSEENLWMLSHHDIFQGKYYFSHLGLDAAQREQFITHPCYQRTVEFCELYDNPSYDAHAETFPLIEFEPILHRILSQPKPGFVGTP